MAEQNKTRYYALDALRGLSILLMIGHHFAYNLVLYGLAPHALLDNWVLAVFQPIFASCFIALSGASSRFSRSNVRRGLKILLCAALISIVTYFLDPQLFISFGILHFLGVCSLLYALLQPLLDRVRVHGVVWLVLFFVARAFFPMVGTAPWLFPFGIMNPGFSSADYYPLLPWFFMYLFGVWLADVIRAGKLPRRFYTLRVPFLERASKWSLWIYLLHQPILTGLVYLFLFLRG